MLVGVSVYKWSNVRVIGLIESLLPLCLWPIDPWMAGKDVQGLKLHWLNWMSSAASLKPTSTPGPVAFAWRHQCPKCRAS